MLDLSKTALLLIGFQNDYFSEDGALHGVVEKAAKENEVLPNTVRLLDAMRHTQAPIINLPIHFSADYSELSNPVGLLATIRDLGAFRRDSVGGETIPEVVDLGDRVQQLTGKTGFNAFIGTRLDETLKELGVEDILLTGAVTSICIDSTGRAAAELGYGVHVLQDCTTGRTTIEHEFYCESIFPLYATVEGSSSYLGTDSASEAA